MATEDQIEVACSLAYNEIMAAAIISGARNENPDARPDFLSTDPAAVSRRIIGRLLEAGWIAPTVGA